MRRTTLEHIGEVRLMHCGQKCTVVGWRRGFPILEFEDGTLVTDKRYDDYKRGSVMNPKLMDLKDYKFGHFTVISDTGRSDKHRNRLWLCQCSCGRTVELGRNQILGRSYCPKSCGCKSGSAFLRTR
ncbi:MAG: hypothetical protein IJV29_01820 [Butyrivibrio sp.]|nr:hypothetical protein [Butyrivibrio sp.]